MTRDEIDRMAEHLGVSVHAFWKRYDVFIDEGAGEPAIAAKNGAGCPLLGEERRCTVHPVKPQQCKSWPFWEEMVDDRDQWAKAKSYCPGLDAESGRLYQRKEILAIMRGDTATVENAVD